MISKFLIKERTDDFYVISLFLSSIILIGISTVTSGFLSYILALGGIGYGISFLYLLVRLFGRKSKTLEYLSISLLLLFVILFIYLLFVKVEPDIFSLIIGVIIIAIPILLINKKFFPSLFFIPSFSSLSYSNYLIQFIEAHPLISLSLLIVGIYLIFKMIKDIVKIIILTVIVWVILRFLFGVL